MSTSIGMVVIRGNSVVMIEALDPVAKTQYSLNFIWILSCSISYSSSIDIYLDDEIQLSP
ncbi:hypothetical protein Scep_023636 [Stephania cephalantha]|uniref:Uncharacterized protein n=1 Tax=Stephania cephalantha TaxID=152367 RepID=A0AAP0EV14_9MAGN